ncbi:MAG TPA: hypothetical protein VND99_00465 [Candidatus Acidoferrales bacterium]|nr:hypothetical protein [Candidatus Acidoferrales bacterium]
MRVSARIITAVILSLFIGFFFIKPVSAQTNQQPSPIVPQSSNSVANFLVPNTDSDVPQNHHSYAQIVFIDAISAIMCELTGVDPSNPNQACLGVNPTTGKIGLATPTGSQTFGQAQNQPVGGAVGLMAQSISVLYVPAVSSQQYFGYLADNFGIVKQTYAAPLKMGNCNNSPVGYGFCGLSPIFTLWSNIRDLAYALLTVLFITIGIGVMLRFKVDPRTVMTLQNQIPRVIIAILLITFSYAIAGLMIDLMWTVTYTGIDFISKASPDSKIAASCPSTPTPLAQNVEQRLLDQPISFTNTIFRADCNGLIDNGLLSLSDKVSSSLGDLIQQLLHDLLFGGGANDCHVDWWAAVLVIPAIGEVGKCLLGSVMLNVFLWLTEQLVKLIIIIAILIALFRLWFQLIKTYLTFLIFVILGPVWIVLGLVPGRPMGFEKWLRIVFSNLAVFPLVAFILVFARVIVDSVHGANPQNVFIPPLVGNPSLSTFSDLMGFGAILLAPSIPDLIKERMKATGQGKYGATIAAGIGMGAAAFSAPGKKVWEGLNRRNPTTGEAEGSLAIMKQRAWQKTPFFGRRAIAKRQALGKVHQEGGDMSNWRQHYREALNKQGTRAERKMGNAEGRTNANTARDELRRRSRQDREGTRRGRAVNRVGETRDRARNWLRRTARGGGSKNNQGGGGPSST